MDSGQHSIVELSDDGDELSWASVLHHDFPKTLSTNSVKGLGQIDIGGVQVDILFLTFLLKLSCSKHHVDSPASFPETALAFRWETFFKVRNETIQQNSCQNLAFNRKQGDSMVVVTGLTVPLRL